MIIVLPITTDTAQLAVKSIRWANTLLGKFDAKLLIVPHVATDAIPVYESIGSLFKSVHVLPTHQLGYDNVWQDVHSHFKRIESTEPWFFWAADLTLLRPDAWPLILANGIRSDFKLGQPQSPKEFLAREIFHTGEPDFRIAIHYGSHDGSLIERLMEERNSTLTNVPTHEAMEYFTPPINKVTGRVRILIVSHKRDFDWLFYCLKSIHKFATGFDGVTVAVPTPDKPLLEQMLFPYTELGWDAYSYDEVEGKGMIHHEERICSADEICIGADWVTHVDSDNVFVRPTHAGQFFDADGRPYWVIRPYASMIEMKGLKKVVGDCFQWKAVTEKALGFAVEQYTMTRHGTTIPTMFYKDLRKHIERVHRLPFREYVLSCESRYPQSFAEFPTLGAFAYQNAFWKDRFAWKDCTKEPIPVDFIRSYWSHAPLRVNQPVGDGWFNGSELVQGSKPTVRLTARQEIEALLS